MNREIEADGFITPHSELKYSNKDLDRSKIHVYETKFGKKITAVQWVGTNKDEVHKLVGDNIILSATENNNNTKNDLAIYVSEAQIPLYVKLTNYIYLLGNGVAVIPKADFERQTIYAGE